MERDVTNSDAIRARAKILLQDVLQFPPQIVDQQLGHALGARPECEFNCASCLLERRKMMQIWSDYVECLMFPAAIPGVLTPLGGGSEVSDLGIA